MKKILILAVVLFVSTQLFAVELQLLHEKSFNVNPGEKLFLEGAGGDIIVTGWDKNEVLVKIYGNKKAEKNIEFTILQKDKEIFVSGKRKSQNLFNFFTSMSVKYEVMVPKKYCMELITAGGDIRVSDNEGLKLVKTSGGDIVFEKVKGETSASTSGGDVIIESFGGDIDASTSGGDIKIVATGAKIEAETSGGDIQVEFKGENKGIEVGTSGGDITVLVEKGFNANAELKTSGGDIEINFPTTSTEKLSSSKFIGKMNNGGNSLICRTSGGDITIRELSK